LNIVKKKVVSNESNSSFFGQEDKCCTHNEVVAPYKLRRSKVKRIPLKTSERYQTKDVGTENKLAIPQVSSHTINGFLQL